MKKLTYSIIAVICLSIIMSSFFNIVKADDVAIPRLTYSTHVQDIGWQGYVQEGTQSGTSGQSLRLEGIKINLDNVGIGGGIEYSTHVQNLGWQGFVGNNEMSGTSGQSLRLEAIKIRLTGEIANQYDIYYRVHAQDFGWLDWTKNGARSGTAGYGYRLEAIEIKLVKKGGVAPGKTSEAFKQKVQEVMVSYSTHVQNLGWQNTTKNGGMAGTTGYGYRLEAIKIDIDHSTIGGSIQYRTHVQNLGWQEWKKDNQISGTSGYGYRLEAIQIDLVGDVKQSYDVYYRVHLQDLGWQEWKKNGEEAGTTGRNLRLEAIEIKIEPKQGIIHGIDVSSFQKNIDWAGVKSEGIQFAMIRMGYRGYGVSSDGIDGKLVKDTTFEYNTSEAIKQNIPVGVYFFSQAINENEAIDEANFVIENIKKYKITYPVAFDTEYSSSPTRTGRADALTKEERTRVARAFCETIKNAGYKPMIYTGKNFALSNLEMDKLSNYDLWLAHYTGAVQDDPLDKPSNYEGNYTMWQYTSNGTTTGIEGRVDMNISYKVY